MMMLRRASRSLLAQQSAAVQRTSVQRTMPTSVQYAALRAWSAVGTAPQSAEKRQLFHSTCLSTHNHDSSAGAGTGASSSSVHHHQHKHKGGKPVANAIPMDQVVSHIELMENWSCSGCGIALQTDEPKKVGYMPKQLLAKITRIHELKKLRCERCYNITHYGKITDAKLPYSEYEKRVAELKSQDMLMIQLVDILDISASLLPKARHLFGNKDVMLVVNKGDLIPEKSGIRRLMRRIQTQAKVAGIENIKAIYLVSAMKGIGMKEIVDDVKKFRKGRDVCVVGAANVGKSTFLNSLMKFLVDRKWQHNHRKYMKLQEVSLEEINDDAARELLNLESSDLGDDDDEQLDSRTAASSKKDEELDVHLEDGESVEMYDDADEEDRQMTTSPLPGTTLAVQHLPIMAKNELFNILDTPGLIVDSKRQQLVEALALDGASQLKNVFPSKDLPMTTFRVQPGRSLFLGGLVRVDYESESDKNLLLFSWHGVLPGHLTSTANADETFIKHAGGLLSPPRGLDALSFTGPLLPFGEPVLLQEYITKEVQTKSKNVKKPKRTSVVELEIPAFGWLTVTAVDLDGTFAAEQTLQQGKIVVSTCRGVQVVPRTPLFPFEMSTSKSSSWKS